MHFDCPLTTYADFTDPQDSSVLTAIENMGGLYLGYYVDNIDWGEVSGQPCLDYASVLSIGTSNSETTFTLYFNHGINLYNKKGSDSSNLGGYLTLLNQQTDETQRVESSANQDPVPVDIGATEYYTTITELIDHSTQKHHHWEEDETEFKLTFDDLTFELTDEEVTAKFEEFSSVAFEFPVDVLVEINDPWYLSNPTADPEDWTQPGLFEEISDVGTYDSQNETYDYDLFKNQNTLFSPSFPIYELKAPKLYYDQILDIYYIFDEWVAYNSSSQDITSTSIFEDSQALETEVVFTTAVSKIEAVYHELTFTNSTCSASLNGSSVTISAPGLIDNTTDYDVFNDWSVVSGTCTILDDEAPYTTLSTITTDVELGIDYYETIVINDGTMTNWETVLSDDDYYFSGNGLYVIDGLSVTAGTATWQNKTAGEIGNYVLTSDQNIYDITNQFTLDVNSDNVTVNQVFRELMSTTDSVDLDELTVPSGISFSRTSGDFEITLEDFTVNGTSSSSVTFNEIGDASNWIFDITNSISLTGFEVTNGNMDAVGDFPCDYCKIDDFSITVDDCQDMDLTDSEFDDVQMLMRKLINVESSIEITDCVVQNTTKFLEVDQLNDDPDLTISIDHTLFDNAGDPVYFDDLTDIDVDVSFINCTLIDCDCMLRVVDGQGTGCSDLITFVSTNNILYNLTDFVEALDDEVLDSVTLTYTGHDSGMNTLLTNVCASYDYTPSCSNFTQITSSEFKDYSNDDFNLAWDSSLINAGDTNLGNDPDGSAIDIGAYYVDYYPSRGDLTDEDPPEWDVTDIVLLVAIVMETHTPNYYEAMAGDVKRDRSHDVLDITPLSDCVTAVDCPAGLERSTNGTANLLISQSTSLGRGEVSDFTLSVTSDEIIRGMQFDLNLDGYEVSDVLLTEATSGFELAHNELSSGLYRVLIYPTDTYQLSSGTYDVVTLQLEDLARDESGALIQVENPMISDIYGSNIYRGNSEVIQPLSYALHAAYPNPFNPMTTITYELPIESEVSIVVYDMVGREVAELINTRAMAGTYSVNWDATDFASSMYIVRLETPMQTMSQKIMLLK